MKKYLIILTLFAILSYGEYKDIFNIWVYELNNHYSTAMTGIQPALFINDFNTAIEKLSVNILKRTPKKEEVVLFTKENNVNYQDKRASLINKVLAK